MKVEEPKKEAKKKRLNSTDSSDTPLKGKRRSALEDLKIVQRKRSL